MFFKHLLYFCQSAVMGFRVIISLLFFYMLVHCPHAYAMEGNIISQHEKAESTFIQLRTVEKEDSSCALSAAWITSRLADALRRNNNASIEDIIAAIGPSETNQADFRGFTQQAADTLMDPSTLDGIDEKIKEDLAAAKRIEELFAAQHGGASARLYVGTSIPHGQLLVKVFNKLGISLENIVIFLDGLYTSQEVEPLSYHVDGSTERAESPSIFLENVYQLLESKIKEDGDFVVFTFAGEFADPFSCWITFCVRQVEGKMQFIVLDPANSPRYSAVSLIYFPGAVYTYYMAQNRSALCKVCFGNRFAEEYPVIVKYVPCCGAFVCEDCQKSYFERKISENSLAEAFQCPDSDCSQYLSKTYCETLNPRIKPSISSTSIQVPKDLGDCSFVKTLGALQTEARLRVEFKDSLATIRAETNASNDINAWIRLYWRGEESPGSWNSFKEFLISKKTELSELFGADADTVTNIDTVIGLIAGIDALVKDKISEKNLQDGALIYLRYLGDYGVTLQTIFKGLSRTERRNEDLMSIIRGLFYQAKTINEGAFGEDATQASYVQVNSLFIESFSDEIAGHAPAEE